MEQLGLKYRSNKIMLNQFHKFYEKYFSHLKDKEFCILELGVGNKSSMNMFLEYFPKCIYYGIDSELDEEIGERYNILKGNHNDPDFLNNVIKDTPDFDIIIDDNTHFPKHQLMCFNFLFKKLNKNGIYSIEKVETSYWINDNLNGNLTNIGIDSPDNIIYIFTNLCHFVNLKYINFYELEKLKNIKIYNYYFHNYILNDIFSISFYPNCILIIHN